MTYSTARFQIRVHIYNGDIVGDVEIFELNPGEGNTFTLGDSTDEINFLNTYRRYIGETITDNALEITKIIPDLAENAFVDERTPFSFVLRLTAHDLAPLTFPITATILDGDNAVARTVTITSTTANFQLAHGETFIIPRLPLGTTFAVTESAHPWFAPEATVIIGGSTAGTYAEDEDTNLVTDFYALEAEGRNAADFLNNNRFVPPTGIAFEGASWMIPAVIPPALASLLFVGSIRKNTEGIVCRLTRRQLSRLL